MNSETLYGLYEAKSIIETTVPAEHNQKALQAINDVIKWFEEENEAGPPNYGAQGWMCWSCKSLIDKWDLHCRHCGKINLWDDILGL